MSNRRLDMSLEADAVLAGLDPEVRDLAEVDEDGAVGGLDLVPPLAALLQRPPQRGQLLLGDPKREHLRVAGEAERGAARADGRLGGITHACTAAGWTSSVRTPALADG